MLFVRAVALRYGPGRKVVDIARRGPERRRNQPPQPSGRVKRPIKFPSSKGCPSLVDDFNFADPVQKISQVFEGGSISQKYGPKGSPLKRGDVPFFPPEREKPPVAIPDRFEKMRSGGSGQDSGKKKGIPLNKCYTYFMPPRINSAPNRNTPSRQIPILDTSTSTDPDIFLSNPI